MRQFFFLVVLVILASCTVPVDESEETRQISAAAQAFSQAYIDGDLEKQMSFYTEDVVIIPGNRPMIEGIEAVTRYWKLPDDIKVIHHRTISTRLEIEGRLASDYGLYEGKSLRGADTLSTRGQYVITWRKEDDGNWRMAVDMWSALR